jgi:hypothetical protein
MNKNYKFLILDKLAKVGECSLEVLSGVFDIAEAMMSTYPEAYRKLKRLDRQSPSEIKLLDREKLQLKINLSKILSKLKKEGIVDNKKWGHWSLTRRGRQKLKLFSEQYQLEIWKEKIYTQLKQKINKSDKKEQILIIFDIPEEIKNKRHWLRMILRSLNFKPLQKSVWIGNRKLPPAFIEAISDLRLLPYIEVFTINNKGTIGIGK